MDLIIIGIIGALLSFLISCYLDDDNIFHILLLFMTFVFISLTILGLDMFFFPYNMFTFALALIFCGFLLFILDVGMLNVTSIPHLPSVLAIPISINCILIIMIGIYFLIMSILQFFKII